MEIDLRTLENLRRRFYVTEFIVYPMQNYEIPNYVIRFPNIPEMRNSKDVCMIHKGKVIPSVCTFIGSRAGLSTGTGGIVFAKIPLLPVSRPVKVYALTGSRGGKDLSDYVGVSCFNLFEDFNGLAVGKWTITGASISYDIPNNRLSFASLPRNSLQNAIAPVLPISTFNYVWEADFKYTSGSSCTNQYGFADVITDSWNEGTINCISGIRSDNAAGNGLFYCSSINGTLNTELVHIFTSTTINQLESVRITVTGANAAKVQVWFDNSSRTGTPDVTFNSVASQPSGKSLKKALGIAGHTGNTVASSTGWIDNFKFRPYANPEPIIKKSKSFIFNADSAKILLSG